MVTPVCIHLRLFNVNFVSGAFTDNIVCNLYMAISRQFHHIMWPETAVSQNVVSNCTYRMYASEQ